MLQVSKIPCSEGLAYQVKEFEDGIEAAICEEWKFIYTTQLGMIQMVTRPRIRGISSLSDDKGGTSYGCSTY